MNTSCSGVCELPEWQSLSSGDRERLQTLYDQLSASGRALPLTNAVVFGIDHYRTFVYRLAPDQVEGPGRIISMGSLVVIAKPYGDIFGEIHDVVTDEAHRGKRDGRTKSYAEELVEVMICYATEQHFSRLELSSRPEREAANGLYQKLGFKLIARAEDGGTNLYRLPLR